MHIDNVKFLILSKFAYTKFSEMPNRAMTRKQTFRGAAAIATAISTCLIYPVRFLILILDEKIFQESALHA